MKQKKEKNKLNGRRPINWKRNLLKKEDQINKKEEQ